MICTPISPTVPLWCQKSFVQEIWKIESAYAAIFAKHFTIDTLKHATTVTVTFTYAMKFTNIHLHQWRNFECCPTPPPFSTRMRTHPTLFSLCSLLQHTFTCAIEFINLHLYVLWSSLTYLHVLWSSLTYTFTCYELH